MADYGPWTFSETIYDEALRMFRDMFFAADSQSTRRGDRIPWDGYDRFFLIHAGSDLQNDVYGDSPEDLPSFTITTADSEAVIFPDSLRTGPSIGPPSCPSWGRRTATTARSTASSCTSRATTCSASADLYNIDTGFPVVGYWSLMDSGNLRARSCPRARARSTPPACCRPAWTPGSAPTSPTCSVFPEVDYSGAPMALANVERHPDVRRVTLSGDEYLLLENR